MNKNIQPGSYEFGEAVATLIKQSQRGVVGSDRQAFFKRASADFQDTIDRLTLQPGEIPIHLLAIGATEAYGANRNGDGFKRAACRKYHPTFVKYANWFRNHKNKDPRQGYGRVIASAYNEPMSRIELIVALNGTKEAAERNHGLLADLELNDLHAGRDIGVSMGCKVALDYCSYCGHASASPEEYCDAVEHGGLCKAGGLKDNMGAIVEIDGGLHHLHADNREPIFYDISKVFRPADRTAYVMGLLDKAANAHSIVSGARMAEVLGLSAPYELIMETAGSEEARVRLKAAATVAQLERELRENEFDFVPDRLAAAFAPAVQPLVVPPDNCFEKQAQFLKACADEQIMLPLNSFLRIFGRCGLDKVSAMTDRVRPLLPYAHNRLLERSSAEQLISRNPYMPGTTTLPEFATWARKHAGAYSLASRHVQRRASLSALRDCAPRISRGAFDKTAAAATPAAVVAEEYALYQLGFLCSNSRFESELPLTAPLALLHNCLN